MTGTALVLPAGFATTVDDVDALVVGYVYGSPGHPRPGSLVQPFGGADTSAAATGVVGAPLYALVSVTWATPVTTIESDGTATTRHVRGWLGAPQGTTWYLYPAIHDAELGLYTLECDRSYSAGAAEADLPQAVQTAVKAWGFGGTDGVPARVRVYNFPR